jgi:formylglycine-generating enzyme required for sulfatase activity
LIPAQVNAELVKIAQRIKEAAMQPMPPRQESSQEGLPSPTPQKRLIPLQPFEPEMILIPVGEFLMGSNPQQDKFAFDDEQPQHRLWLPNYYLAKTPLTNAQYRAFVQATGYNRPEHWTDGKPPRGKEDHPVVHVSWYDAKSYCDWLSEVTGRGYGLPSEAEWEKGARGTDGRIYPWGNQWDSPRCNSSERRLRKTTLVHAYPQGASPYGVLDTVGNVWEWTHSLLGFAYLYRPTNGRENLDAPSNMQRVVRGGVFNYYHGYSRCACRGGYGTDNSHWDLGFRVVMHP